MSVKVMGLVWDAEIDREQKFVLLAYADHADHEGKNIYPAIKTIAKKTGYSRRSVQRITRLLVENGYLVESGKGIKGTNKYKIPLLGDKIAPVPICQGDKNDTEGVTPMSPEPSFNHQLKTIEEGEAQAPNIFRLYEQNIGLLTPILSDKLQLAEETYPWNWIERVFEIAVENNKRNWAYMESILKRWNIEGFDTPLKKRTNGRAYKPQYNKDAEIAAFLAEGR